MPLFKVVAMAVWFLAENWNYSWIKGTMMAELNLWSVHVLTKNIVVNEICLMGQLAELYRYVCNC